MDAVSENPILTPEQKIFLARFAASELRDSYYLTGGTALAAFHLRHRYSDDLDLFTEDEVSIEPVMAFVRGLPGFRQVSFQHKFDRRIFLLDFERAASLKVEFTRYPFSRLDSGTVAGGITVDSLRDILANKLAAMTERQDVKDYVDIYCAAMLPGGFDIRALVQDAESKFGIRGIGYVLAGRFLQGPVSTSTLRMREPISDAELRQFFLETARIWIAKSVDDSDHV